MRLIDGEKIYDAVERRYQVSSGIEHRCERDFLDLICETETVDAVEVVRCKDCKNYVLHALTCRHENFNGIIHMNGFCSYGERKDNE